MSSHVDRTMALAQSEATISSPARSVSAVRIVFDAFCRSFLAYRRYEHLKQKGIPHRAAITAALGASSAPRDE
jgi:hypothetical protein